MSMPVAAAARRASTSKAGRSPCSSSTEAAAIAWAKTRRWPMATSIAPLPATARRRIPASSFALSPAAAHQADATVTTTSGIMVLKTSAIR
jgi:hypothetical protein